MSYRKIPLLLKIVVAIILGIVFGLFLPIPVARVFQTFNSLFGNFLSFIIPLIILGLVTPAIGELGKGAGKLLLLTAVIAYGSTIFSGAFTFFSCREVFPSVIGPASGIDQGAISSIKGVDIQPFFTVSMPPPIEVMTALILSFCLGLGVSLIKGHSLQDVFSDFRDIITHIIEKVIIPLLPLYIFSMFLNMTISGQVGEVIGMFLKVIVVVFILHILLLLIQYSIAGIVTRRNPLLLLKNMLPAYATALGTSSSAATIPVTLKQTIKNKVRTSIASFTVPLCATIHLAGSTMKIVAFSMAILVLTGQPLDMASYFGFIMMLGITMVAAPGVPGGAIMAALGILQSMLGFTDELNGLMITLYLAVDSFGTACNVTGDGAIALVVDRIAGKKYDKAMSMADDAEEGIDPHMAV